jgi:hypothetical protein
MLLSFSFGKLIIPIVSLLIAVGLYVTVAKYGFLAKSFAIYRAFLLKLPKPNRLWRLFQLMPTLGAYTYKLIPITALIANVEHKLLPKETMPQNMQSSYVSLLLIGICVMFLLVFTL